MFFIKNLLTLRVIQTFRLFSELGVLLFLILLGFFSIMLLSLLQKISTKESLYWSFLMVLPAVFTHFSRKDARFLMLLGKNNKLIYVLEYLILSIPICILLIFFQDILTLIVGIIFILFVAFFLNTNIKSRLKTYTYAWIPLYFFEWRMGFRKNGIFLIVIYLLALIFSRFEGVILLLTVIFSMSIVSFYDFCEPKEWLKSNFSVSKKILNHLLLWTLLLSPHICLSLYFHLDYYYLPLIAWYFGAINLIICITYKYSKWSPFRQNVGINIVGSVFFPLIFLFITSPIVILASLYYYSKTKKNNFLKC